MPVDQRLAAAAKVYPFDGADDDPVAMAFDDFLDCAIDDGERVLETPRARRKLAPSRFTVVSKAPTCLLLASEKALPRR